MQAGSGSESVLKLAIEQYEEIIKLDATSVEDHLLGSTAELVAPKVSSNLRQ